MVTETAILEILQPQFQEYQSCEDEGTKTASARATNIHNQISILQLNEGLSGLAVNNEQGENDKNNDNELLASILLTCIDAAIAADVSSNTTSRSNSGNETEQVQQETVDRVLDLAVAIATTSSQPSTVVEPILARAVQFSSVLLERIRGQACRLLGYMVSALCKIVVADSSCEWAKEFLDDIKETLILRLTDKSQAVRKKAIEASCDFFIVEKEDDINYEDLLERLLWNLWYDPSVSNRMAALETLPITSETIDHIISRVRDIKTKVRVKALDVLKNKIDLVPDLFTSEHFAEVIQSGFQVRCKDTKAATAKLVCCKWMKVTKFNPIELLKLIGVVANEDECEQVVKVVLDATRAYDCAALSELSDPETRAFNAGVENALVQLSSPEQVCLPEQIFFSRVVCCAALDSISYTSMEKDALLSKVVPDIPVLCEIFQRHAVRLIETIKAGDDQMEDIECLICSQLLNLVRASGLNEEGSRRHFAAVMKRVLSSGETPDDLIEACVKAMSVAYRNESEFFESLFQILSELLTIDDQDEMSDDLEVPRLLRALAILSISLEVASPKMSSSPLLEEFAKIIVPAITNSDALVREAGVGCFGKLGLFMNEEAVLAEFKPLLLKVAFNADEKMEIRGQAILAVADWSMLFNEILRPCPVDDDVFCFVDLIKKMMDHNRPAVAAIAAEVTAKLHLAGRICESSLIAQLLYIFFDPCMSGDESDEVDCKEVGSLARLQQILSLFFPAYCMKSSLGRDATMGSIASLMVIANRSPPRKSKKRKVTLPLAKMIEFVCSVVDVGRQSVPAEDTSNSETLSTPKNTSIPHGEDNEILPSVELLASVQVAQYLAKDGSELSTTILRSLCKFIGNLKIEHNDADRHHLSKLKEAMEEVGMVITDATCLRSLTSLNEQLLDVALPEQENSFSDEETLTETENEDDNDDSKQGRENETSFLGIMDSMSVLTIDADGKENKQQQKQYEQKSSSRRNRSSVGSRRSRTSNASSVLESLGA